MKRSLHEIKKAVLFKTAFFIFTILVLPEVVFHFHQGGFNFL